MSRKSKKPLETARRLREAVRKSLVTAGYWRNLQRLSDAFSGGLSVTGGWVRCAALGEAGYFGDVDILTRHTPAELYSTLEKLRYRFSIGARGNARINVDDGNYIDISSTHSYCAGGSLDDTLESFNFSVNAGAIGLSDHKVVLASRFLRDSSSKTLRVNAHRLLEPMSEVKLLKGAEILRRCYELQPASDKATRLLLAKARGRTRAVRSLTLETISSRVLDELGIALSGASNIWIVRGSVRASLLGELEYWDDIDVVIDCPHRVMMSHLNRAGLRYSINYFGNPKILCNDGGTIDLWCLPGRTSIESHLQTFVHNVDAIAWNIGKKSFVDPLYQLNASRPLEIDLTDQFLRSPFNADTQSYALIKAIYLIVRHRFKPTTRLLTKLRCPAAQNGHAKRMRYKLSEELACTRRALRRPILQKAIRSMGLGTELLGFSDSLDW